MPGMYPDDRMVEIFGEQIMYPGLDQNTHKFTDGDFNNPLVKPSHIPAETFNLLLDNMASLIGAMGLEPNNTDPEQLKKAMQRGFSPRRVGEIIMLAYEPTVTQFINMRLVPLKGQLLQIALYQDLFELMYVGDENNDNAPWWYRCNLDGTRSITGLYFVPVDMRGLFPRAAGQNSYYRTGMDDPLSPPYDGGNIGQSIGDAIRNVVGILGVGGAWLGFGVSGATFVSTPPFIPIDEVGGCPSVGVLSNLLSHRVRLDLSTVVPVADENRPASISALACISY